MQLLLILMQRILKKLYYQAIKIYSIFFSKNTDITRNFNKIILNIERYCKITIIFSLFYLI